MKTIQISQELAMEDLRTASKLDFSGPNRFTTSTTDPMTHSKQQEFLEQIQTNQGIVHKVVRLYVDHPEERKDLFQEIVLQSWRSYDRFSGKSKFSTWLYRVALNTVLTYQRKQKKQPDMTSTDGLEMQEPSRERSEKAERLWQEIRRLNQVDRMIMVLHLESYSNEEIAQITGISKNNATVKLHRIKQRITKKLQS